MVHSNDNVTEGTMPDEAKMSIDVRYEILQRMQKDYKKAERKERSQLLDQMERLLGLNRKTLIRHMKRKVIARKPRSRQRGRTYGHDVDDALRVIAESMDYICAERLHPTLVSTAGDLARHGELEASADVLQQLQCISLSTLRRRLRKFARLDQWRLPQRRGPHSPNPVTRDIPMKRIPWDEQVPGHFEVDLVHHSGPSTSGDYVHTIQMIDVATGWSERVAVLGRSQLVMEDGFERILDRLPFEVLEIHPDNGSEFFNHHLLRFWKDKVKGVRLSRSRPFHKNDNRFVEQKNHTLVRAYLGHERLDSVAQTRLLNRIYDKMWLYYNFFQPVMRLQDKTVLCTTGPVPRVRRSYDQARTPFQRLCATQALPQERRQCLEQLRLQTNPRLLRQEIYDLLDHLFSLPGAVAGQVQNVLETLTTPLRV
jgi:hypothetical protein